MGRWPDGEMVRSNGCPIHPPINENPYLQKAGILVNWFNVVYCQGNLVLVQGTRK
ncbi:MAG: hypothetical protein F6K20_18755 [Moorea sp. SIO2C4]|nr:hypothetical protein [Moorena sp. SIO2C4]